MLPTGLPTKYKDKRLSLEDKLANLLNIYGIPNSYKWTYTYIDYYRNNSLYSLINLIKLSTNYGTAYCCSALSISLGRVVSSEVSDLRLLYPKVSHNNLVSSHKEEKGELPSLDSLAIYFNEGAVDKLNVINSWFDYQPFLHPSQYIKEPLLLTLWLEEPYRTYFSDMSPTVFIPRALRRHASFATSVELNNLLEVIFSDRT